MNAERLVSTSTSTSNILTAIPRQLTQVPAWVWLSVSGLLSAAVYYVAFTAPYPLDKYIDKPNYTIARLGNFSAESAFLYVAAFLVLFGLYYAAIRFGLRPVTRLHWMLVILFAMLFNIILLPMYPADAADIYDYIIRGRMSANYGLNPMADTPSKIKDDPFFNFAAYHNTTSAYGPAWEMIAALGSRIAGDDQTTNVYVFKLINVIGYALTTLFVGMTLAIAAPQRMLSGVALFAWNPLVLFMSAGTGHHDTLMAACLVLGVYCVVRRWYVAGTLAATLGFLIKFIPILMIPFIALIAFRQLRGTQRIRYFVLSAVLCGLLTVFIYAPYWNGIGTLGIERRTAMYTGSVATVARQTLAYIFDGHTGETSQTPNTNNVLRVVVPGLFLIFYLYRLDKTLHAKLEDDPVYLAREMSIVLLFYLAVTCTWFQSWYVLWIIPLAALLDNTPLRRAILWFSYLVTWESFMYNFVTLRIGTGESFAPIHWRDLVPIAAFQLPIWGYVVYYWLSTWWQQSMREPKAIKIGEQLQAARLEAHLTPAEVADRAELHTDDLIAYETGSKMMPYSHAKRIRKLLNWSPETQQ